MEQNIGRGENTLELYLRVPFSFLFLDFYFVEAKQISFYNFDNRGAFVSLSPDKTGALFCATCCYATLMTTIISFSVKSFLSV